MRRWLWVLLFVGCHTHTQEEAARRAVIEATGADPSQLHLVPGHSIQGNPALYTYEVGTNSYFVTCDGMQCSADLKTDPDPSWNLTPTGAPKGNLNGDVLGGAGPSSGPNCKAGCSCGGVCIDCAKPCNK